MRISYLVTIFPIQCVKCCIVLIFNHYSIYYIGPLGSQIFLPCTLSRQQYFSPNMCHSWLIWNNLNTFVLPEMFPLVISWGCAGWRANYIAVSHVFSSSWTGNCCISLVFSLPSGTIGFNISRDINYDHWCWLLRYKVCILSRTFLDQWLTYCFILHMFLRIPFKEVSLTNF